MSDLMQARSDRPFHVLVIDPEMLVRRSLQRVLQRHGSETTVDTCATVETGLARIAEGTVDLVIAELIFPGEPPSNWALLHGQAPDRPLVVFHTAHREDSKSLIEQGALEVLQKPASSTEFQDLLIRAKAAVAARRA